MDMYEKIQQAKNHIESKIDVAPRIGMILGSGLGDLADTLERKQTIPYKEIPHFPMSKASGHAGELVIGSIEGRCVVAMKGRIHFYEGVSLEELTFPVRVMHALGVRTLIITNACGAVNERFQPGELMIITDHLNLVGINPLIGDNDERLGPRFPDLTDVYSKKMRTLAKSVASRLGISIYEGVYAWWSGPAYETKAEIRMIRMLGADAVGMSTVPEAIVAAHAGIETLGISCLTNMAAGILDQKLSHEEVLETAARVKEKFSRLIVSILKSI